MRMVVISSTALACVVALLTAFKVGLAPPSISFRDSRGVGAHTQILVDGPRPGILSTVSGTTSYQWLRNGGLLLGNIMTSGPGADYIARRAHLPAADMTSPALRSCFASRHGIRWCLGEGGRASSLTVAARRSVSADRRCLRHRADGEWSHESLIDAPASPKPAVTTCRGAAPPTYYQLHVTQLGHDRVIQHDRGPASQDMLLRFIAVLVLCVATGRFVRRSRAEWRLHRAALQPSAAVKSRPASGPLVSLGGKKDV